MFRLFILENLPDHSFEFRKHRALFKRKLTKFGDKLSTFLVVHARFEGMIQKVALLARWLITLFVPRNTVQLDSVVELRFMTLSTLVWGLHVV